MEVSIHALLAECDMFHRHLPYRGTGFNPRTPCGVRQLTDGSRVKVYLFQSTHSLRSATKYQNFMSEWRRVSIHALLAECDTKPRFCIICIMRFNPRTPCGVRHVPPSSTLPGNWFQSTHSLRSATAWLPGKTWLPGFQSTHSLRSATIMNNQIKLQDGVSIHALLAECDIC